jgi:hypothetical protein
MREQKFQVEDLTKKTPERFVGSLGMMKIDVRMPVPILGGHWVLVRGGYGGSF